MDSICGLGRSPGEGHDKPLQYSCLENRMDRGAWQAIIHWVIKSQTWLKWLNTAHGNQILSQSQGLLWLILCYYYYQSVFLIKQRSNWDKFKETSGIFLACTFPFLEHAWKCYSLIRAQIFMTQWIVALQAPLSLEFSRQEYWSGLPFPFPGDLPNPGIEHGSPALQAHFLPSKPPTCMVTF